MSKYLSGVPYSPYDQLGQCHFGRSVGNLNSFRCRQLTAILIEWHIDSGFVCSNDEGLLTVSGILQRW